MRLRRMRMLRPAAVVLVAAAVLAAAPAAHAGWQRVGDSPNEGGIGFDPRLADVGGVRTVAWRETGGGSSYNTVRRFTENFWTGTGSLEQTNSSYGSGVDVTAFNGQPVVAVVDTEAENPSRLWVLRLQNGVWERIGGSLAASEQIDIPDIERCGSTLCVAWSEFDPVQFRSEVRMKRLSGATWSELAPGPLNQTEFGSATSPVVGYFNGTYGVAWVEDSKVRAAVYSGTAWVPLGENPIRRSPEGTAEEVRLALAPNGPHLAWVERTPTPVEGDPEATRTDVRVARYDFGTSQWTPVAGGSAVSDPQYDAGDVDIAMTAGRVHVAYTEYDTPRPGEGGGTVDSTLYVKRLSSGGRSWERVRGTDPIDRHPSFAGPRNPDLVDVGGVPHLAFEEEIGTSRNIYVLRFVTDLVNTSPPTVSGTPKPGDVLTCSPGGWTRSPDFDFIWERAPRATTEADDPAWVAIDGAGDPQYTVQQDDAGSNVRCRVVATSGENEVEEAVSAFKRADSGPPANSKPPHVNGTPIAGQTLTCDPGEWASGADLSFQWLSDGNPIAGATGRTYVLRSPGFEGGQGIPGDGGHEISCRVSATNDIGTTTVPSDNSLLAVNGAPLGLELPRVIVHFPQPNLAGVAAVCAPGKWTDDYSATGRDGFAYEYEWVRNDGVIAGATDQTYSIAVEDLGKDLRCRVTASNPAGRALRESAPYFVELPRVTSRGRLRSAQGKNQFVPTNFLALGREYEDAVQTYAREQLLRAKEADERRCRAAGQFGPQLARVPDRELVPPFGPELRCRILWHEQPSINVRSDGAWLARVIDGRYQELDMGFGIAPVDPSKPLPLDPVLQSRVAAVTPVQVIWDVDDDGRTDATCPGSAPVLRSLLDRGDWNPRAIVVYPDSVQTGVFSEARFQNGAVLENPPGISNLPEGTLRNGQPFACRTSLEQPPEPASQPCVTEGRMGRVRVTGNLCPINVRAMDQGEIDYLKTNDNDLYQLLVEMAKQVDVNARRAARRAVVEPETTPELLPRQFLDVPGAPAAAAIGTTLTNTASSYAGFKPDGRLPPELLPPPIPAAVTQKVQSLKADAGQFAMDQMYVAKGALKVNGITFTPQVPNPSLIVPSDVQQGLTSVKEMKLTIPDARKTLDNLVLEANGRLRAEINDKVNQGKTELMKASLDKIKDAAKNLKFGPFQWGGDMDIKLNDDGTATMTATATIPFLTGGPGGGGLSTKTTLRGDLDGRITLQGFTLKAPSAYLGAMKIKDLFFRYENGVKVQGKIIFPFPPSNPAIAIHNFELGPEGGFRALDLEFEAGAGAGIPVGPGVFLTSVRAGYNDPLKKFTGGAGISVGPSAGGGCPTVGVKAEFHIVFQRIVTFDAEGNVTVACIPLFNIKVHADTTGYVTVAGGFNFSEGPFFITSTLSGSILLPEWQLEYKGTGGIRKVPLVGTLDAELQGVLGNRGLAACGSMKVFLLGRVSAGGGVRFSDGRPPLSYAELLSNLRLFTGCDLSSWKSLPARVRAAQAGGGQTFTVPAGKRGMGWSFQGAGDAPRVRLRSPSGRAYDFGDAVDGKEVEGAYGVIIGEEDRTVVLIGKPEAGRWTVEPVEGSPAVARIERADILPPVKVTGKVGGIGSSRVLRYRIPRIPGQVVRIVEEANGAQQPLRTVRGGGRGTVRFQTAEANGTRRRIVAQVVQDGLPRDNVTVARFTAPSPRVGRPRKLRVQRRGNRLVVTWRAPALARTYDVRVSVADGQRLLLTPEGRRLRVTVPRVPRREGAVVRVVGISRAGRRGPVATKRVKPVRRRAARRRR